MQNIIIVCTTHSEKGACTSLELLKIFERIDPDVIFEEIPPSKHDFIYNISKNKTLETEAVKLYIQKKDIPHIPVDIDYMLDNEKFWSDVEYMFAVLEKNSIEYAHNKERLDTLTCENGFNYLNSDNCVKMLERLAVIEKNVLERLNDDDLFYVNNFWYELHRKREIAMINSIYQYCIDHCFNNAVLYVGVQHGHSIIKRVQQIKNNYDIQIKWKFNDLLQ